MFVRINVAIGAIAVSLSPIFGYWSRIRAGQMELGDWSIALLALLTIQVLFWYAPRRCSGDQLSYWRGVTVAAQCMRTHWVYFDVLLSLITLPPLIVASFVFALSRDSARRFHKLVHFYYVHRLQQ